MWVTVILGILTLATLADAGDTQAPDLLFEQFEDRLSRSEQAEIVRLLDLKVSVDGKTLLEPVCGQPASFQARVEDLNRDGTPEIFIVGGNTCLSGGTGSSVWLFIKDESGHYRQKLGFPAAGYEVLNSTNAGMPDLKFGGPGFCRGVWRWNGSEYVHFKNEPDEPGGCDAVDR